MNQHSNPMTWRELAASINGLGLREQTKPVRISLDAPSYISYALKPTLVLGAGGLCLQLSVAQGLIAPRSHDIAIFCCDLLGIDLVESQDEVTLGRWCWINNATGDASRVSFDDRELAATAAIQFRYPKSDWMTEVENGDTDCGYAQWALSEAFLELSRD